MSEINPSGVAVAGERLDVLLSGATLVGSAGGVALLRVPLPAGGSTLVSLPETAAAPVVAYRRTQPDIEAGDVWQDNSGCVWFARRRYNLGVLEMLPAAGGGPRAPEELHELGQPLQLLYRLGGLPAESAPEVDDGWRRPTPRSILVAVVQACHVQGLPAPNGVTLWRDSDLELTLDDDRAGVSAWATFFGLTAGLGVPYESGTGTWNARYKAAFFGGDLWMGLAGIEVSTVIEVAQPSIGAPAHPDPLPPVEVVHVTPAAAVLGGEDYDDVLDGLR